MQSRPFRFYAKVDKIIYCRWLEYFPCANHIGRLGWVGGVTAPPLLLVVRMKSKRCRQAANHASHTHCLNCLMVWTRCWSYICSSMSQSSNKTVLLHYDGFCKGYIKNGFCSNNLYYSEHDKKHFFYVFHLLPQSSREGRSLYGTFLELCKHRCEMQPLQNLP